MAHRRAFGRDGLHRFTFFRKVSQALAGFFPGWMLRKSAMCRTSHRLTTPLKGCAADLHLPKRTGSSHHCGDGLFYSLNEKMYVRIVEEIEARNARRNYNKQRPAGRYKE